MKTFMTAQRLHLTRSSKITLTDTKSCSIDPSRVLDKCSSVSLASTKSLISRKAELFGQWMWSVMKTTKRYWSRKFHSLVQVTVTTTVGLVTCSVTMRLT